MNALARFEPYDVPMTPAVLDEVLAVERAAYPHPWTRGNFVDSLAAGYEAELRRDAAAGGAELGMASVWLEVRPSNAPALALYERCGMRLAGRRRGYYPAAGGAREDALVMKLGLDDGPV